MGFDLLEPNIRIVGNVWIAYSEASETSAVASTAPIFAAFLIDDATLLYSGTNS